MDYAARHVDRECCRGIEAAVDLNRQDAAHFGAHASLQYAGVILREAIESVRAQIYENWELCIADDCSTRPRVRSVLNEYAQRDPRIKVVFRDKNGHISQASNSALELVTGEWVAMLDHDDVLRPHALAEIVLEVGRHPDAELIYSDEDKIDFGRQAL